MSRGNFRYINLIVARKFTLPALADISQDIAGNIPLDVIKNWTERKKTRKLHDKILQKFIVRGTVVVSDSVGLSKITREKSLIDVMKLVSYPKEIVYKEGSKIGGRAIGVWAADNTQMFYPEGVHCQKVLLAMEKVQNELKENELQIGMAIHYGDFLGVSLKAKTLGVVGTGKIGLAFMRLVKPFDLTILAYDVFKNEKAVQEIGFKYVALEELLQNSDFISLHVPFLPETKHMIGDKEIKQMKDKVILVNTARGAVIDTKALLKNISKFKAVALDVLEEEQKFNKNHPLLKYDNVIITPHIAFFTDDSVRRIAKETETIIQKFKEGNKEGRGV